MLVWFFPSHKCQKSLSKSQGVDFRSKSKPSIKNTRRSKLNPSVKYAGKNQKLVSKSGCLRPIDID